MSVEATEFLGARLLLGCRPKTMPAPNIIATTEPRHHVFIASLMVHLHSQILEFISESQAAPDSTTNQCQRCHPTRHGRSHKPPRDASSTTPEPHPSLSSGHARLRRRRARSHTTALSALASSPRSDPAINTATNTAPISPLLLSLVIISSFCLRQGEFPTRKAACDAQETSNPGHCHQNDRHTDASPTRNVEPRVLSAYDCLLQHHAHLNPFGFGHGNFRLPVARVCGVGQCNHGQDSYHCCNTCVPH